MPVIEPITGFQHRRIQDFRPIHRFNLKTTDKTVNTDTIVISDIHLGSDVSRSKELRKALKKWYPFKRLIILGDLFEDLNFKNLTADDFAVIDDLRQLARRTEVQVDWIEGNHDLGAHDLIHRLIGCHTHDELVLDMHGKRYLLMHGHQFDVFLQNNPIISEIAGSIYIAVQTREGKTRSLSRWLKKKSKRWLKVCQKVERLAVTHADTYGVDYILCGHTHYYDANLESSHPEIKYINTGCWTDSPCTVTTICEEHGIKQHVYS